MGAKPHDWFSLPICSHCHRKQHEIGERAFWHVWGAGGICRAVAIAQALYLAEDHQAREEIVRANQGTT